jgi:hypothetical protein
MTSSLCIELLWSNHRFEGTAEKLRFSIPVEYAAGRPLELNGYASVRWR